MILEGLLARERGDEAGSSTSEGEDMMVGVGGEVEGCASVSDILFSAIVLRESSSRFIPSELTTLQKVVTVEPIPFRQRRPSVAFER